MNAMRAPDKGRDQEEEPMTSVQRTDGRVVKLTGDQDAEATGTLELPRLLLGRSIRVRAPEPDAPFWRERDGTATATAPCAGGSRPRARARSARHSSRRSAASPAPR